MFKIKVNNFGPIKKADFDIRPLTVLVGPNNTGKTYIAYLLNSIKDKLNTYRLLTDEPVEKNVNLFLRRNLVDPLIRNKSCEFDVVSFYDRFFLDDFLEKACQQLSVNFPTEILKIKDTFTDSIIDINLKDEFRVKYKNKIYGSVLKRISIYAKPEILLEKSSGSNSYKLTVSSTESPSRLTTRKKDAIVSFFYHVLYLLFDKYFFPGKQLVLPSERTALVFAFKDIYQGRAEKSLDLLRLNSLVHDATLSKYPAPVVDFLRFMYELRDEQAENGEFTDVIEHIESTILGGKISLERAKDKKIPTIYFRYGKEKKIEIHGASSGVKSISPLLCFLKEARMDDLLIIDEPEINLHPMAQVHLMCALAMAVNKGLSVIITTHSPYIVDPLNHLIRAFDVRRGKRSKIKLEKKFGIPEEAFLSKSSVSAYRFDTEGLVHDIMDYETGMIDWGTFGDVSSYLYDLDSEIDRL